ncbi:sulfite exporter TauE/SafE family protein [Flavobacteriaceae bacterium]|nr:sulfite exporter TauE/SafE family protein [Flavobacteriaceae bacterium]
MLDVVWAPAAGAFVGLIVGLTGVGGGALMAPILLFAFGIDLVTVVATDLLFATVTKITASSVHHRNALVDWQITKRMWLGSIPACIVIMAVVYQGYSIESHAVILKLLGGLILISALSLLFGSKLQLLQRANRINDPEHFKKYQGPATTIAGGLLGGLVALTSVGAGALGAVILRSLYPLRMTAHKLVATDTIHAIPVSLIAGFSYLLLGFVDLTLLGYLLAGSIPAALLGSKLMNHLPQQTIKLLLGSALLIAGLKILAT